VLLRYRRSVHRDFVVGLRGGAAPTVGGGTSSRGPICLLQTFGQSQVKMALFGVFHRARLAAPVGLRAPNVIGAHARCVQVRAESDRYRLHNLAPAKGSRRQKKRIGRGHSAGQVWRSVCWCWRRRRRKCVPVPLGLLRRCLQRADESGPMFHTFHGICSCPHPVLFGHG
jgi:hypothetical protein